MVEGNEDFRIDPFESHWGAVLARPLAIGTIIDDDGAGPDIHAGVGDPSLVEGDTGNTDATCRSR